MILDFLSEHAVALQQKTAEHIALSGLSLLLASMVALPLGVYVSRVPWLRKIILPMGSISQTIPSLAMLGFLIPLLGLGNLSTLVALTFYAIYPIMKSTYIGLKNIPEECLEAAQGLGLSTFQKLWWVELPLALPVIISGVRVATALTIGITSIAALIGAGGLGDFIMQGLSLNNTSLILLGAIPTAFLALCFDYAISQIEDRLQNRENSSPRFLSVQKSFFGVFGLMLFIGLGFFCYKNIANKKEKSIVIASKNFTESFILAEMMAQLIEAKTSLKVTRKFNLGTSNIIHQAMLQNEIDLYPEYTGTAYLTILKKPLILNKGSLFSDVQEAYKKKFDFVWLDPFGFSNSQTMAIHVDYAEQNQIKTLSELARTSHELNIAAPPEFLKRPDALPGLIKWYGLKFKKILQMEPNLMYAAIKNKKVDVIVAFSTDGKIQQSNLVSLVDDKNFYPSYEAAAVARQSLLDVHPEIYQALSPLFGGITHEKMMRLNYQVDVEGKSPSEVVQRFLAKHALN